MRRIVYLWFWMFCVMVFLPMGAIFMADGRQWEHVMEWFHMFFPIVTGMGGLVLGYTAARS